MLSEDDSIQSTLIQKAGFLYKLPFRRQQGKWQQRFFILKDSYMLYYGKKKKVSLQKTPYPARRFTQCKTILKECHRVIFT